MEKKYLDMGKKWLEQYDFNYDWLFAYKQSWWNGIFRWITGNKDRTDLLKEALKYSPIGISVYAWQYRNGLAYKLEGQRDNHWVMLYGYEEGKYWKIYDHYDKKFVQVEWNYPFGYAMRYSLNRTEFDDLSVEEIQKKYSNRVVKGHLKSAVYLLSGFKKHLYPDAITFRADGHKWEDIITLPQRIIDQIPDGIVFDIRDSNIWTFIKDLKYPENMRRLEYYLDKFGYNK